MRLIPLWLSRFLVLALLSSSAASADEGELFTYTDSKTRGCFAHLAGNDWVEFAADGRVSSYQEVARNTNNISLSSNSLGVGVRLLGAKAEWKQGSKAPISRQGMFTRTVDLRPEFDATLASGPDFKAAATRARYSPVWAPWNSASPGKPESRQS